MITSKNSNVSLGSPFATVLTKGEHSLVNQLNQTYFGSKFILVVWSVLVRFICSSVEIENQPNLVLVTPI